MAITIIMSSMENQILKETVGVSLAIDFDEARILYRALRDYQIKRVHEDSVEYTLCDGLLGALKPYVYTQRQEQPT
jgi:hypothetical protein